MGCGGAGAAWGPRPVFRRLSGPACRGPCKSGVGVSAGCAPAGNGGRGRPSCLSGLWRFASSSAPLSCRRVSVCLILTSGSPRRDTGRVRPGPSHSGATSPHPVRSAVTPCPNTVTFRRARWGFGHHMSSQGVTSVTLLWVCLPLLNDRVRGRGASGPEHRWGPPRVIKKKKNFLEIYFGKFKPVASLQDPYAELTLDQSTNFPVGGQMVPMCSSLGQTLARPRL